MPRETSGQIARDRIQEAKARGSTNLDLSGLGLSSVPESIGQLAQLQELNLSDNQLTRLPESLSQLAQLKELSISNNQLTKLPESLSQLAQLRELYLFSNQLTRLPESLKRLIHLRSLYLHDNPALSLPPEILGATWKEVFDSSGKLSPSAPASILDYYFRIHPSGARSNSGAAQPLNEAKLILVGRGEVGKTCIVNRLVRDEFVDTSKTQGISINLWPIRLGEEEVRLHIWDFGGQEIMHATHQFFLSQRSVYLLVLHGRKGGEDADAEYWLQLIESFGGESPVLVVLNKIKEHPFDLNRRGLQGKYPSIRGFIRTDCEDGTGFDELHAAIRRETDALQDLRVGFPASWVSIKERLSRMAECGQNYLNYAEYQKTCEELGEGDPAAQEALAGYLHCLGIALNYKDDLRLNDTHVLSPHWVTNGIYSILNWPELEARKGVLRLEDLATVLEAKAYPKGRANALKSEWFWRMGWWREMGECYNLRELE